MSRSPPPRPPRRRSAAAASERQSTPTATTMSSPMSGYVPYEGSEAKSDGANYQSMQHTPDGLGLAAADDVAAAVSRGYVHPPAAATAAVGLGGSGSASGDPARRLFSTDLWGTHGADPRPRTTRHASGGAPPDSDAAVSAATEQKGPSSGQKGQGLQTEGLSFGSGFPRTVSTTLVGGGPGGTSSPDVGKRPHSDVASGYGATVAGDAQGAEEAQSTDLIDFLARHRPPGAGTEYGSGHAQATGGALRPQDWNDFAARIGFPEETVPQ